MNFIRTKKNKQANRALFILRLFAGALFVLVVLVVFVLVQKYRFNVANSKAELIMHNYQMLDEKTQFIEVVAAETDWVQNMSMLDTQGFEEVFPLDLYDAQASIRNYNALIGFTCETIVLFDNSDYALTASGALPYKELESYFDDTANFNIYSEGIYGGVQYVRNSDVVTSVIYNCPNTLNGYNFRLIFIIAEEYLLNYLAETGDIDINTLFISFTGNEIFAGKDYRSDRAATISSGDFLFGYSQGFPVWRFIGWLSGALLVFGALYALIYFKISNYYDSMQTYMRMLNELAGKPYTEENSDGITKRFGEILSEISKIEMQSKMLLSDDFTKLVEEYVRNIVHSGESLNEEALLGLQRLGVSVDKNISIIYFGCEEIADKTGFGEFYDLGDAIMLTEKNFVPEMNCVYGSSKNYRGLEYASRAYCEAENAYETAVFYERKNLKFPEIGRFTDLPHEAEEFKSSLGRLLMASEEWEINRRLGEVKAALLRNFIYPAQLKEFFKDIDGQLSKIENEKRIEDAMDKISDKTKSIEENIEDITRRSARIIACFRQKSTDRYSYYFFVIKSYVDKNFCNPDISLASVAEEFGFSIAYVSKIFTGSGNISYSDYINSLRIEKAKKMLAETDLSVNVIASQCGVLSSVTFRRIFKKYTNMLPGEYRDSVK